MGDHVKKNIQKTGWRIPAGLICRCAFRVREVVKLTIPGICLSLLATVLINSQTDTGIATGQLFCLSRQFSAQNMATAPSNNYVASPRSTKVNFEGESASSAVRKKADWVVTSGDNQTMPFVIVDKQDAKVFVFDADGRLRGAAPALLGLAIGDKAVPGIGKRKLSSIRPEERTTPAGRFVASMDRNIKGKEIIWVDYDTAVSLHPVVTTNPSERRAERLATPTPLDNRISYGCINVPAKFFKNIVRTAFKGTNGIVYVLPEEGR